MSVSRNALKGDRTEDTSWLKNVENVQIFSICRLHFVVLLILTQKNLFLFLFCFELKTPCWFFTHEEQKKVGS